MTDFEVELVDGQFELKHHGKPHWVPGQRGEYARSQGSGSGVGIGRGGYMVDRTAPGDSLHGTPANFKIIAESYKDEVWTKKEGSFPDHMVQKVGGKEIAFSRNRGAVAEVVRAFAEGDGDQKAVEAEIQRRMSNNLGENPNIYKTYSGEDARNQIVSDMSQEYQSSTYHKLSNALSDSQYNRIRTASRIETPTATSNKLMAEVRRETGLSEKAVIDTWETMSSIYQDKEIKPGAWATLPDGSVVPVK